MFITRPLLLRNYGQIWPDRHTNYVHYLRTCLTAARDAVELILSFVRENQLFHAFWFSQYIAFNALSIIYIYFIQVERCRIVPVDQQVPVPPGQNGPTESALDHSALYKLSETAQYHLANATVRNAPSWKYSAIVQSLRQGLEQLRSPSNGSDGTSVDQDLARRTNSDSRHREQPARTEEYSGAGSAGEAISSLGIDRRSDEPWLIDARTESLFDTFA